MVKRMRAFKILGLLCLLGISWNTRADIKEDMIATVSHGLVGAGTLFATGASQYFWIQSLRGEASTNQAVLAFSGALVFACAAKWFACNESRKSPRNVRSQYGKTTKKFANASLMWLVPFGLLTTGMYCYGSRFLAGSTAYDTPDIAYKATLAYWLITLPYGFSKACFG